MRERRGLAGAGTRDHEQGLVAAVKNCCALLLVQGDVRVHLSI